MAHADQVGRDGPSPAAALSLAALILLGTRFVQGFIFWGGASRRLIYDFHDLAGVDHAVKLDFELPGFVAAKLTHALPGALWVQGPIEWTLRHPDLIVASVWLWTFAELAVGLGLMLGLATRLSAFASIWLNVTLMLIFGWMGSTCLDEWTMAVSGVAMSSAVFLAGGGAFRWTTAMSRARALRRPTRGRAGIQRPAAGRDGAQAGAMARHRLRAVHRAHLSDPFWRRAFAPAIAHQLPPPPRRHVGAQRCRGRQRDVRGLRRRGTRHRGGVHRRRNAARRIGTEARPVGRRRTRRAGAEAVRNAYPYAWASRFRAESIGFSGQTGARATITLPPTAAPAAEGEARVLVLEAIDGSVWRAVGRVAK